MMVVLRVVVLDKGLKDQEGQTQVSGSLGLVFFLLCGFFSGCFFLL